MFRHTDKISQQSHQSAPTGVRMILFICIIGSRGARISHQGWRNSLGTAVRLLQLTEQFHSLRQALGATYISREHNIWHTFES